MTEFTVRNYASQKDVAQYFLNTKSKKLSTQNLILSKKQIFRYEGEIKTTSDEGKLRELDTHRPTLKRWLNKIL